MYLVELEKDVWLASLDGDPGRTLVKENAEKFKTKRKADEAIIFARTFRPFLKAEVVPSV